MFDIFKWQNRLRYCFKSATTLLIFKDKIFFFWSCCWKGRLVFLRSYLWEKILENCLRRLPNHLQISVLFFSEWYERIKGSRLMQQQIQRTVTTKCLPDFWSFFWISRRSTFCIHRNCLNVDDTKTYNTKKYNLTFINSNRRIELLKMWLLTKFQET